jgi:hypothetical protein
MSALSYIPLLHQSVPNNFVRLDYLMLTRLLNLGSTQNLIPLKQNHINYTRNHWMISEPACKNIIRAYMFDHSAANRGYTWAIIA